MSSYANRDVVAYYDYTQSFYRNFWFGRSNSYAMHYGLWKKETRSLHEALLNTNSFLSKTAHIGKGDLVLDAGCGVGGSSIWLAKNIGANVVGISLSRNQVEAARKLAAKNGVSSSTSFYVKDYTKTGFPDGSFDVVWAIESICHAPDKKDFFREAYRVLKKNGRLVIADGFISKRATKRDIEGVIRKFEDGFVIKLAHQDRFGKEMGDIGFRKVTCTDKTKDVMRSSKRIYDMCRWAYPLARLLERLGLVSNILAKNNFTGIAQYRAFRQGLCTYCVFYGVK